MINYKRSSILIFPYLKYKTFLIKKNIDYNMGFDLDKKNALTKLDKSKKGEIDQPIKNLLDLINKKYNFYTSSSCSGRIILFEVSEAGKKDQLNWIFVSHKKTGFKELKNHIKLSDQQLWLRQESFILHVCCRTIEDAKILLHLCEKAGLKRAGIHTLEKKIMVEIINTPYLNVLIGEKNKIFVNDEFLKIWLREANKNMSKNYLKIKQIFCFFNQL
jgi:tRNA wybutosine-synthesizing protein 3